MLYILSGNLYAKAPIAAVGPPDYDQVSDSSRYFVIRLKNDNGQTAFVGIGFADRSDSFDLNVAIQDHFKMLKKDEELDKEEASKPKLDLSFKEGQTITVNIGVSLTYHVTLLIRSFRRKQRLQLNDQNLMEVEIIMLCHYFHHLLHQLEEIEEINNTTLRLCCDNLLLTYILDLESFGRGIICMFLTSF